MSEPASSIAIRLLVLVACVGAFVGCSPSVPSGVSPTSRAAPDPKSVNINVVDRGGYDAAIAQQRGQVVLVDHWAQWCEPCVAHFGHFVDLANRHADRGLVVVSLNLDSPSAAERTLEFLKAHQAGAVTNLISQYGGGSQSMEVFDVPRGSLPCYKLYDRSGKLRQTFSVDPFAERQFTLQDVDAAVEKLLAE